MIGAVIGAKLLFLVVSAEQIIRENNPLLSVIKGGFFFYGGLAGGVLGLAIYRKQYRMKLSGFADLFTTVLPIGHAFGRVGCFFLPVAVTEYRGNTDISITALWEQLRVGIPLLPLQLIEAGALLLLFAVQLILFLHKNRLWQNTVVYFFAYLTVRFILEFFRGDIEREALFGLSTSQWISLLIISIMIAITVFHRRTNTKS